MGSRTTKVASDGSQTICDECGQAVRGQKGLKAHKAMCVGAKPTAKTATTQGKKP